MIEIVITGSENVSSVMDNTNQGMAIGNNQQGKLLDPGNQIWIKIFSMIVSVHVISCIFTI